SNSAPGGLALLSVGKAWFEGGVSAGGNLVHLSQTTTLNGGNTLYASNPASNTAAIAGFSSDTTVPGPGTSPGAGVKGVGPVGMIGATTLVNGIGVAGVVSSTAAGVAVFGVNDGSGSGVSGESSSGIGVSGRGVTGTSGFA